MICEEHAKYLFFQLLLLLQMLLLLLLAFWQIITQYFEERAPRKTKREMRERTGSLSN